MVGPSQQRSMNIAIYLDFENLAISADQAFSHIDRPLELGPILDYALSKGVLCIKRAFADWNKPDCFRYVRNLNKYGFDLRYLPSTSSSGKNGSDIQMVIDILEDLQFFPIIDAVVIGSGDTDFLPVIKRVLARGKPVYIVGFDDSVADVIRENCSEYCSLNNLFKEIHASEVDDGDSPADTFNQDELFTEGRNLLNRYIRSNHPEEPVLLSRLKLDLLRLDPSFSENNYGFKSFTKFLESYIGDVIERNTVSASGHPQVIFRSLDEITPTDITSLSPIDSFISQTLKLQTDRRVRMQLAKNLLQCLLENPQVSMKDMVTYISDLSPGVSRIAIRKYVFTLGQGRVFHYANREYQGSLLKRPQSLNIEIKSEEQIEDIYHKRISEIIRNRYSDVDLNKIDLYKQAFE